MCSGMGASHASGFSMMLSSEAMIGSTWMVLDRTELMSSFSSCRQSDKYVLSCIVYVYVKEYFTALA